LTLALGKLIGGDIAPLETELQNPPTPPEAEPK
jgi:hypothetical protein